MEELVNSPPLNELQSKLKLKFPELTESDLRIQQTSHKDMLRMIAYKLRKTKNQMRQIIQLL